MAKTRKGDQIMKEIVFVIESSPKTTEQIVCDQTFFICGCFGGGGGASVHQGVSLT